MAWAGIKRGDPVVVVHRRNLSNDLTSTWHTPGKAVSVGKMWITVEVEMGRPKLQRFQACNGHGEYGAVVHTAQSWRDEEHRQKLLGRLRRVSWESQSFAVLKVVLRTIEETK